MAYVRIWVHCVWVTKNRTAFITGQNKMPVLTHIRENAEKKGIFIDFMNAHKEHVHCIVSLNSDQCISKVMQLIKGESSFWINKNKLTKTKFEWGDEYYAGSISESDINKVRNYIKYQDEHHRKKSWDEEYKEFLDEYGLQVQG